MSNGELFPTYFKVIGLRSNFIYKLSVFRKPIFGMGKELAIRMVKEIYLRWMTIKVVVSRWYHSFAILLFSDEYK